MADDIDIEEHALLDDADVSGIFPDDPNVSGIFPDFPDLTVKTEVIDIEDGFDHQDDLSIPSTSVIPDSTTDVDYQPPRTTDSPHIISSTSIPEDPEEITDQLNLDDLEKTTEIVLCNNETDVNVSICEDGLPEGLHLSVNDVSINEKPDITGVVDEFVDEMNDNDNDKDVGNNEAFFSNCIILGSKVSDDNKEGYYSYEDEKCFNSFVDLEDWGPYLSKSDCYCSECEILFATVNALDFHKMQTHSHLVAVFGDADDAYVSDDSPKDDTVKAACSLCSSVLASKQGLRKHMRLMHNPNSIPPVRNNIILGTKKVASDVSSVIKPSRTYAVKSSAAKAKHVEDNTTKGVFACFVCQFQCSSDDGLIDHLYKFHTFRCEVCNTVFAKKEEHEVHMLSHNPQLSIKQQKTEHSVWPLKKRPRNAKPRSKCMVRRCVGCPAQYTRMRNLKKHYMSLNIKWKEPLVPNQEFDPLCPVCSVEIPDQQGYNKHVSLHDCHAKSADGQIKVAKCKMCPAQFFTAKLLMDHCESIHKLDLDSQKKPIANNAFDPCCPLCSKTFAFPGVFNKHLESQHSIVITAKAIGLGNVLVSKTFPSPLKLPLQTSTKVSFKCLKCNVLFPDLAEANNHKESKHAKLNDTIIKKVTQQIALIQTSFLFRCDSCDVHFTSPSQGVVHVNSNCTEQKNSIPCKQCNLKININDVALHNKKHEITDELTVIDISDGDLNVRVLCKCPSCRLHFSESEYYSHYMECSAYGLIPYWCVFCNLYIDIKAQTQHDRFHYQLKLKKEALIVLEYKEIVNSTVVENIEDAENKVEKSDQEPKHDVLSDAVRMDNTSKEYKDKMAAIQIKTEGIYKLIECTFCGTFRAFNYDSAKHHTGGKCKKWTRRPCEQCGLRVLNAARVKHEADHSSFPSLNIKDTLFFDESLNVIKPRVPKLFKCKKCSINYESQYHLDRHKCIKSNGQRCVQCNVDIVKCYYAFHMQYHEYRLPRLSGLEYAAPRYEKNSTCEGDNAICNGEPQPDMNSDEIINKTQDKLNLYECSKSKKILLYQCKKCNISSVSGGFRQIHSICKTTSFTCDICNLNFAATYRMRHQQLHTNHPNITFNSYQIIEFEYEGSPHIQPNYRTCQLNKLKLKKRGYGLFSQCMKCKLVFIGRKSFLKHQTCTKYAYLYNCEKCGYSCAPAYAKSHKRWHKRNPNFRKGHIIISSFNPGSVTAKSQVSLSELTRIKSVMSGRLDNALIKNVNYESVVKKPIKVRHEPENSVTRSANHEIATKKPKMFQCYKCGICSTSRSFPHSHNDCETTHTFKCKKCRMKFLNGFKKSHSEFHMKKPDITLDYFNIVRFDPDRVFRPMPYTKWSNLTRAGKVILIQCVHCKISSTSRYIMQNHLSCDRTQPLYSCKLCGYKLAMSEKQRHTAIHFNRPQLKRSDIIVSEFDPKIERQMSPRRKVNKLESNKSNAEHRKDRYIIFRCEICDVCTEEGMEHECKEGITKVVCRVCSLTFEEFLYGNHAAKHSDPNYSKKVEIINIEGETPSNFRKRKSFISEPPAKIPRLSEAPACDKDEDDVDQIIRCNCDLHFLTRISCSNHIRVCKRDRHRQSSNICTHCHISFHSPKSLDEHITRHHDENKDFTVISYAEYQKKRKILLIYKCSDCALFFPTFEELKSNTHLATCGLSGGVTCVVCGFEIMESFVNEHAKVHAIGRPRGAESFKVIVVPKDTIPLPAPAVDSVLYKCTKCEVHFLNTDGIECHYPCENSSRRHTKCPECGLKFYSANLYAHVTAQHTKHNYDINDLIIKKIKPKEDLVKEANLEVEVALETDDSNNLHETEDDTKLDVSDLISDNKPTKKRTLYQCIQCKVNFVSFKKILNHKVCSIDNPPQNFTCVKCNLVIHLPEKDEHLLLHHSADNNLTCESDYVIHKRNSYQNSNKTRKSAEKYPVFGCRSVKGGVKSAVRHIKSVMKSRNIVGQEEEPNLIYKCYECDICFICKGSLINHCPKYAEHESAKNKMPCDVCGLQFGPLILKQHKIIHHDELNLKLEDFKILTIQDVRNDTLQETDMSISESDTTIDSTINDSVNKVTSPIESKSEKESTPEPSLKLDQHKVKLYKCKDCNVNFLKQNLCYRHVINHEPLSTYDFLECKICNLNFQIQHLQQHMAQHKKEEFGLKDILIEEYEPLQQSSPGSKRSTPKIDIYYAIDKVSTNLIELKDNTITVTETNVASNESSKTESNNDDLSKVIDMDTDTSKEKTESDRLQVPATISSVECTETKIETETSDGDAKSIELSAKDDVSLQSMDIETDYNDGKILIQSSLHGI